MGTINTTALAKRYGITTKALEQRLTKLGIEPAHSIEMPSGKRFLLWDAEQSVEALDRYKEELISSGRTRAAKRPKDTTEAPQATERLEAEVAELKSLVQTLITQLQKEPDKTD